MSNADRTLENSTREKTTAPPRPDDIIYTYDEALAVTQTGKFHYMHLLVCGLCFAATIVETLGLSLLMLSIKCDFKSTTSQDGILGTAGFVGTVLGSHASGLIADTWGRVKTLRTAVLGAFISNFISVFSINIWMLIVLRLLNGIFIAGCQACTLSYCGEFHCQKTRTKYTTLLSVFLTIALIYISAIAWIILPLHLDAIIMGIKFSSWRYVLLGNSVITFMAFICLLLLPESPKYTLLRGFPEKTIEILAMIFRLNTGKPNSEYPVKKLHPDIPGGNLRTVRGITDAVQLVWLQTGDLFCRKRCLHTLNICFLLFIFYFIAHGLFLWFPTMLTKMHHGLEGGSTFCQALNTVNVTTTSSSVSNDPCDAPVDTVSLENMTYNGVVFTGAYIVLNLMVDWVGKVNLILVWLVVTIACCLALHWVNSFIVANILLLCIMTNANSAGITSAIAVEYFPTKVNATAMCLVLMVGRLGAAAGSYILSYVLFTHCDMVFYILAGVLLLVAIPIKLLPELKKPWRT